MTKKAMLGRICTFHSVLDENVLRFSTIECNGDRNELVNISNMLKGTTVSVANPGFLYWGQETEMYREKNLEPCCTHLTWGNANFIFSRHALNIIITRTRVNIIG